MAAVATETRGQRRPRTAKARTAQRRLVGGIAWIVVVAALLAGIVALNVAVLRTNLALDDLNQKRVKLRAENAALMSQLAGSATTARIQKTAADELGATPASPEQTTYVPLVP